MRLPAAALIAATLAALSTAGPAAAANNAPAVRVAGNKVVDGDGRPFRLLGTNVDGTQFVCVDPIGDDPFRRSGVFYSPVGDDGIPGEREIAPMRAWHFNTVRLLINEDCWRGKDRLPRHGSANGYRRAMSEYAKRLNAAGFVVILALHTAAPDGALAYDQWPMASVQGSVPFWRSVAKRFRGRRSVVFDLYNEPLDIGWRCLRDGCTLANRDQAGKRHGGPRRYKAAGMQALMSAVRKAGARNPVIVHGLRWSSDVSKLRKYLPRDPARQIIVGWHNYENGGCRQECWDRDVAPLAADFPLVADEFGDFQNNHDYADAFMPWADARGIGYIGQGWAKPYGDSAERNPTLIADYDGTPTRNGEGLKGHLEALLAAGEPHLVAG